MMGHAGWGSGTSQEESIRQPGLGEPGPGRRPQFEEPRDVHVSMEVYERQGEAAETWDEQVMIPEDQTRYLVLVDRLNFFRQLTDPTFFMRRRSAHGG